MQHFLPIPGRMPAAALGHRPTVYNSSSEGRLTRAFRTVNAFERKCGVRPSTPPAKQSFKSYPAKPLLSAMSSRRKDYSDILDRNLAPRCKVPAASPNRKDERDSDSKHCSHDREIYDQARNILMTDDQCKWDGECGEWRRKIRPNNNGVC